MAVIHRLWLVLVPDLARFAPDEQPRALAQARRTEFDAFELVGLALAVGVAAALTPYALPGDALSQRLTGALLNFVIALPVVAALAAPFQVRRLRRGVRELLRGPGFHE